MGCQIMLNREAERMMPVRLLFTSGAAALVLLLFIIAVAMTTPWLGLELQGREERDGLTVLRVLEGGPARDQLHRGDIIVAVLDSRGEPVPVATRTLIADIAELKDYAALEQFFSEQTRLADALRQPSLRLVLENGAYVTLTPAPTRPLRALPGEFWIEIVCGYAAFLISFGVWAFRRRDGVARVFAVAGIGMLITTFCDALIYHREMAIDGAWLRGLTEASSFGALLAMISFVALLWRYPTPLHRFPFVPVAYVTVFVGWLVNLLHWDSGWDGGPAQLHYALLAGGFFALLPLAWLQWRRTRGHLEERAALKWLCLIIVLFGGSIVAVYVLPLAMGIPTALSADLSYLLMLAMWVGLAVGIARYRLFNVDRWWFEAWMWGLGGIMVMTLDALLLWLNVEFNLSLAAALALAGWGYFPLRQQLWRRYSPAARQTIEQHLPELIAALFSTCSGEELQARWQALLQQIYAPLSTRLTPQMLAAPTVAQNGLALHVPGVAGGQALELLHAQRGQRLFDSADERLATAMLSLMRQAMALHQAQAHGAKEERTRIMRDLHDDVGAKLLTLTYRSKDEESAEIARSALQDLRDVVSHSASASLNFTDTLANWRAECADRLDAAAIRLQWRQPDDLPSPTLLPQQTMNIGRILREAISNAIRHAQADNVMITIEQRGNEIHITLENDGLNCDLALWGSGRGTQNIKMRAELLGGAIHWRQRDPIGCRIEWWLPLRLPGTA
jgi:signal transduction histidine kinase